MKGPDLHVYWDTRPHRECYRVRAMWRGQKINQNVPRQVFEKAHVDGSKPNRDAEREAKRWAVTESEKIGRRVKRKGGEMSLEQGCALWAEKNPEGVRPLTITRNEQMTAHLTRLIKLPPSQIDLNALSDYRDARIKDKAALRTIWNELVWAKQLLAYMYEVRRETGTESLAFTRLPNVDDSPKRGISLTEDEVRAILRAKVTRDCRDGERLRRLLRAGITTLLRATPLLHLREDWIDRDGAWLTVPTDFEVSHRRAAKGGIPISIPLSQTTMTAIGDPRDGYNYVFGLQRDGGAKWFAGTVRTLADDKVCRYFSAHDLRRTGITWLELAGAPPFAISILAGHVPQSMTDQYKRMMENRSEAEKYLRPVVGIFDGIFARIG